MTMKKPGEEAIKLFIKNPDQSATWVIRKLAISPNTLYQHPQYAAAVVMRKKAIAARVEL